MPVAQRPQLRSKSGKRLKQNSPLKFSVRTVCGPKPGKPTDTMVLSLGDVANRWTIVSHQSWTLKLPILEYFGTRLRMFLEKRKTTAG